jgi:hypothetical protein
MSAWSNGIAIAIVSYVLHHRSTEKAKRKADQVIFIPRLAARIAFYAGTPFFLVAAVTTLFEIPGDHQWGISLGFVGFAVLSLYCWPGIIIVDSTGVRQVWIAICRRRMAWAEIKTAAYIESDNYVVLKTADGKTLRTSFLHTDPQTLVNEITKHVRVDISKVKYV